MYAYWPIYCTVASQLYMRAAICDACLNPQTHSHESGNPESQTVYWIPAKLPKVFRRPKVRDFWLNAFSAFKAMYDFSDCLKGRKFFQVSAMQGNRLVIVHLV